MRDTYSHMDPTHLIIGLPSTGMWKTSTSVPEYEKFVNSTTCGYEEYSHHREHVLAYWKR